MTKYIENIEMVNGINYKINTVPSGGNSGQVLTKSGEGRDELHWVTPEVYDDTEVKANIELLSTNKVDINSDMFDGHWVDVDIPIASNIYIDTAQVSYNLSEYLPDDDYDYECYLHGECTTADSVGAYINLCVSSDILTVGSAICAAITNTTNSVTSMGQATIPVGVERILNVASNDSGNGNYSINLRGYKRLGRRS